MNLTAPAAPPAAPPPLSWRAAFGTTLAVAMAAGTFPGYAFGVLGPYVVSEFTLARSQLGLLTTVFFLVGGGLSLVAGPTVDRLGGRRVMLGAFAVVAVAVLGMAAATSYAAMLAMAGVAGLSLAAGNPTTNKLVALHVPRGRRGVIMGFKQAGVQVGAFLAGALLAPAAVVWGWRAALAGALVVPVVGAVATLRIIPADPLESPVRAPVQAGQQSLGPAVWWLAGYAFLMGSGVAVAIAYLPLYAVERLSLSVGTAGSLAAAIGFTGIGCRVMWGWASERLTTYRLPLLGLGVGAVLATLLIVAAQTVAAWLVWPAAVLFGATAVTWNSVGMLALLSEVDPSAVGRASGYVLFGFYGGFVASPIAFGAIVDVTGSYHLAWAGVTAVFAVAALLIVVWGAVNE